MDFLDQTYVRRLLPRLDRVKWVRADVVNMKCPICGDSVRKNKRRGYIYTKGDKTIYHCFNCQASMLFGQFLKLQDPFLYSEYRMEKYRNQEPMFEKIEVKETEVDILDFLTGTKHKSEAGLIFSDLPSVWSLPEKHPGRRRVEKRLVPQDPAVPVLYASNFPKWASSTFENLAKWSKVKPHPRFVLPCYDSTGKVMGFCARSYGPEEPKYCNVNLDPSREYFYGLDRLDRNKPVMVCEGAIDSLMIDNCIAVLSSALHKAETIACKLVYVIDHQPRNKEIVHVVHKLVKSGKSVVLWPDTFQYKDMNEARCAGMSKQQLTELINQCTFQGLRAEMEFTRWKKI